MESEETPKRPKQKTVKVRITREFDCDEGIADVIKLLNEKARFTLFCCSGHGSPKNWRSSQAYIMFAEASDTYNLGKLPDGFFLDTSKNGRDCRAVIRSKNRGYSQKDMDELKEWAEKLYYKGNSHTNVEILQGENK